MLRLKIHSLWLVLLMGVIAISASCKSAPLPKEYRGTIYYGDFNKRIWKMTLPDKKTTLLASMQALPEFGVSPDQKWLTYYASTSHDKDGHRLSNLWVVSTQGGEPIQVSHEVLQVGVSGWENGWLRYFEVSAFRPDPNNPGFFVPDRSETYLFNPETKEHRLEPEPSPQPALANSGPCRDLAPGGRYDTSVEQCIDVNGNSLLHVSKLGGSNPITVPMAYRNGEVGLSGDGRWLAFTGKDARGTRQVFMLDIRGKEVWQITGKDSQEEHDFSTPSWSPDGKWLAFQTDSDLCIVRIENRDLKCFKGYVSSHGEPPAWSPDSGAIVMSSNRIGKLLMGDPDLVTDLFIICVPEGDATRITNNPDGEFAPIWVR